MLRQLILILALLPSLGATVATRQGKFFEGDVQFVPGTDGAQNVKVTPTDGGGFALTFPLADIASMAWRPPLIGVLSGSTLRGDWGVRDIGSPGLAGSAISAENVFELRGEGAEFGKRNDEFVFVWQRMPYEGQLIARLAVLNDASHQSLAGLVIRQSLDSQSPYSFVGVGADAQSGFVAKPNLDFTPKPSPGPTIHPPCWLKLTKLGDRVYGFVSPDGSKPAKGADWKCLGSLGMEGLFNGYVGMMATSRHAGEFAIARFDNVILQRNGLQADFYADAKFADFRASRIDPKIDFPSGVGSSSPKVPAEEFWVRWTGRLAPTSTEEYSFRFTTSEPAKLFINGQKMLDTNSRVPMPPSIKLSAEREYDIRIEYHKSNLPGLFQLVWQARGQSPQVVPSSDFIYRPSADEAAAALNTATPFSKFVPLAKGVLLTDGTFLPGSVKAFDGTTATFFYCSRAELPIAAENVARVTFQPLANSAVNKLGDKAPGLLTQQGEYVEGDVQSLTDGALKLNSVVLGASNFDIKTQAAALILHPALPGKSGWLIHTISGGVIHAASIRGEGTNLIAQEPLLGAFAVPITDLMDAAIYEPVH